MTPDELAALHARAMRIPRPWRAEEFAALLAAPGVFLTGGSSGFALGRSIGEEAELLTIVTDPDKRRRGHARAALSAFEAEAARRGSRTAFLEVAARNGAALALYAAQGWSEIGRRPGYYEAAGEARIDALVLKKILSAH